jgi:hypothetical protein
VLNCGMEFSLAPNVRTLAIVRHPLRKGARPTAVWPWYALNGMPVHLVAVDGVHGPDLLSLTQHVAAETVYNRWWTQKRCQT